MRRSAKGRWLFVVLCLATALYGSFATKGHAHAGSDRQALFAAEQELEALRSAHAVLATALAEVAERSARSSDRSLAKHVARVTREAHVRSERLLAQSAASRPHPPARSAHGHGGRGRRVGSRELQELVRRTQEASFSSEQVELVELATRGRRITVDQALSLMRVCTFDATRIEIAAILHARLADPHGFYRLADGFSFRSSFDTLARRVGKDAR